MKITFFRVLSVMLCFIGAFTFSTSVYGEAVYSGLVEHFELYGYSLPADVRARMQASFSPFSMDCGDVKVSLDEVLYDGRWVYTAASITPTDPKATLIMPGSAETSDLVSGIYGENWRDDHRTFLEAAVSDAKRLLCVYAYPKEFDLISPYFLDHFQLADNKSVLLSGACVNSQSTILPITWAVSIYEVNKDTGEYLFLNEYNQPCAVTQLQPIVERRYLPRDSEELPLNSMIVYQSGLTVYVSPEWKSTQLQERYELRFLDSEGTTIPNGAPPEVGTLLLDQLPREIYVQTYDSQKATWAAPVMLTQNIDS